MKNRIFCLLSFVLITIIINAEIISKNLSYFPKDAWRTSSAEEQQMKGFYLDQMHKIFDQNGLIVVIRNGYLIDSIKK